MSALTPVYTVGDQIAEAIEVHNADTGKRAARARAVELLNWSASPSPNAGPAPFRTNSLAGNVNAWIAIAIATIPPADLWMSDHALDVTVAAQILRFLRTARDVTGRAVLIITHDLGVVADSRPRTVMYAGRAVRQPTSMCCTATANALHRRAARLGPRLGRPAGCPAGADPGAPPRQWRAAAGLPVRGTCRWPSMTAPPNRAGRDRPRAHALRASAPSRGRPSAGEISACPPSARRGRRRRRPVVLRVPIGEDLKLTKGRCCADRSGRCVRSTASASNCSRRARSASSANPARQVNRHCTRSWICPHRSRFDRVLGADVATLDRHCQACAARRLQVVFQDPVVCWIRGCRFSTFSLNRCRPTVLTRIARRTGAERSRSSAAPRGCQPHPCRVLRRAEATQRHRASAGATAEDPGSRRTGVGTRRVDTGRIINCYWTAGSVRLSICSSRTTCRSSTSRSPRRRDAQGKIVEQRDGDQLFTNPQRATPAGCLPQFLNGTESQVTSLG